MILTVAKAAKLPAMQSNQPAACMAAAQSIEMTAPVPNSTNTCKHCNMTCKYKHLSTTPALAKCSSHMAVT